MRPNKQTVVQLLRRTGLLEVADIAKFRWVAAHSRAGRDRFRERHGNIALPPDDLAYDAYGTLDWEFYWSIGRELASELASIIKSERQSGELLEWGCGPARIIRHLPELLGDGWKIFGSDANRATADWCAANIAGITFSRNDPAPPLSFGDEQFDCVYAISVFTHLSEQMHHAWIAELWRILRPGGTLIVTTHGDAVLTRLRPEERDLYEEGNLVVRGHVVEGKRLFLAYHPTRFVRDKLLVGFAVLSHKRATTGSRQVGDLWIARKRPHAAPSSTATSLPAPCPS
jgi:SAM-dependent methyltransferase